ncbi:hypothetical protein BI049_gp095 [Salmonella phage vB_SnwM_CGG4-1]|uniref:Uncharacterized protein n=1 Tax=Salmonella phage vB_SnwM_CGG4-1 TaxID=1815631 RepID=A0A1B0VV74_9CAUD|nr:hypothetical protein BI049_gp095 [Salmonella phage vB_SnwM_CGG4-1]ANA49449.1 hypothetical protein CGG41_094 [Salmonella phage vB_SnwM_CGG4-1]
MMRYVIIISSSGGYMKNVIIAVYLFVQYNHPLFTYNLVNGIIELVKGSLQ